mgnify:FL=1
MEIFIWRSFDQYVLRLYKAGPFIELGNPFYLLTRLIELHNPRILSFWDLNAFQNK